MSTGSIEVNQKPWTSTEDARLLELIGHHGIADKWAEIARGVQFRSEKQCQDRYINRLDPLMTSLIWTTDEDSMITKMHSENAQDWENSINRMPGRSDIAIKRRFHVISQDDYCDQDYKLSSAVAIVIEEPIIDKSKSALETTEIRLERFRAARQLLDDKIEALVREQALEEGGESPESLQLAPLSNITEIESSTSFDAVLDCIAEAVADIHALRAAQAQAQDSAVDTALLDSSLSSHSTTDMNSPTQEP